MEIKDYNYITIQGFMVTDLKLKGNELMVYAIIFGFSQYQGQVFNGNLQYLCEWTNSSKQGVIKALKSLQEKGLIGKTEKYTNGVKSCEYYVTENTRSVKEPIEEKEEPKKEDSDVKEIIDYLNAKAGTRYRADIKATINLIHARKREKYTLSDFKKVIDNKCRDWVGTDMEQYIRPQTLFGTKFENYLNANAKSSKNAPIEKEHTYDVNEIDEFQRNFLMNMMKGKE